MQNLLFAALALAPRRIEYYSYGSAVVELTRLATLRPDLASLSTAQALYELPTAGTCRNADGSRSACLTHVLEITNRATLAADPERPEVLFSGALHGDERVGPVTTIELARWLIERYDVDPWVKRLVDTRVVLCVPMTNAIGVEQLRREELGIDPNRDFPYDQEPSRCMKTVAARAVNELYRHHALQIVITYHAGMQAIGYNWGSFNYYHGVYASPDDNSMHDVAAQLSRFAGTGNVEKRRNYPYGPMSSSVYPVHGGMEDWGYGASWDKAFVKPCTPSTYGGYSKARTTYTSGQVPPRNSAAQFGAQFFATPPSPLLAGARAHRARRDVGREEAADLDPRIDLRRVQPWRQRRRPRASQHAPRTRGDRPGAALCQRDAV